MKLGRLEKVELRQFWIKEDRHFTPWLAEEDNIKLLGDTIGIELEVKGQEENVGLFRADILCIDTSNNHYVLIENQLERTDHTHLGQLMTYAAGLDAVTIVWIAPQFSEQHRAALDWLNRITDDSFSFFGIEVELYRIGESDAAPLFRIVSKPNDWAKGVRTTASGLATSARGQIRQEYWTEFKLFMETNGSALKVGSPSDRLYSNFSIGSSKAHVVAYVKTREKTLNTYLWFSGPNHKENFDELLRRCSDRSREALGKDIVWNRNDGNNSAHVARISAGDYTDQADWPRQFAWFKENVERFAIFFKSEVEASR